MGYPKILEEIREHVSEMESVSQSMPANPPYFTRTEMNALAELSALQKQYRERLGTLNSAIESAKQVLTTVESLFNATSSADVATLRTKIAALSHELAATRAELEKRTREYQFAVKQWQFYEQRARAR